MSTAVELLAAVTAPQAIGAKTKSHLRRRSAGALKILLKRKLCEKNRFRILQKYQGTKIAEDALRYDESLQKETGEHQTSTN